MLHYNLIDASEGATINKVTIHTNAELFLQLLFLQNLSFQSLVCNHCHDLMQRTMIFKEVVFVFVKGNSERIHFFIHFFILI